MYVHKQKYLQICINKCVYINMHIYVYVYAYIHSRTYVFINICVYKCIFVYLVFVHIYLVYIRIYKYIHIHFYKLAYIQHVLSRCLTSVIQKWGDRYIICSFFFIHLHTHRYITYVPNGFIYTCIHSDVHIYTKRIGQVVDMSDLKRDFTTHICKRDFTTHIWRRVLCVHNCTFTYTYIQYAYRHTEQIHTHTHLLIYFTTHIYKHLLTHICTTRTEQRCDFSHWQVQRRGKE